MLKGEKFIYENEKFVRVCSKYDKGNVVKINMYNVSEVMKYRFELMEEEQRFKIKYKFNVLSKNLDKEDLVDFEIQSVLAYVYLENYEYEILYCGKVKIHNEYLPIILTFAEKQLVSNNITSVVHFLQIPTKIRKILVEEYRHVQKILMFSICMPLIGNIKPYINLYVYNNANSKPQRITDKL